MDKKRIGILVVFIVIVALVICFFMRRNEKKYEAKGEINKIVINENESGVKIKKSEDDKIRVIYREGKGLTYEVTEKDGVLEVENDAIKFSVSFSLEDESVIIELPKDYGKEIEVNSAKKCEFIKGGDEITFSNKTINDNQK